MKLTIHLHLVPRLVAPMPYKSRGKDQTDCSPWSSILGVRHEANIVRVRVRVTLWLAVYCQSVRLGAEPLKTHGQNFFLNRTPAIIVLMQHSLWREDRSVIYNCCWSSPAHSFSGPSPVGLATIYYCLRFETSLFVASYDSQGCGGGTRPRLHTGILLANNQPLNILLLRNRGED
jgi:hypothetical protein